MGHETQPHTGGAICELRGKERLTKGEAKSLAKRVERRSKRGYPIDAYQCEACGSWHIGRRRGPIRT